jgi:serine/threonine protein kinase
MIWFSHPCIVKLVDVLEEDGQLNLVYELFGENLLELYSASKHGLNENQIRCIVYQVALAL